MYNCSLFNLFGFCWCCAAFDVAPIFDARRQETKTRKNTCRKKNANLGAQRNLHLMLKTCRNKDPKHILC